MKRYIDWAFSYGRLKLIITIDDLANITIVRHKKIHAEL